MLNGIEVLRRERERFRPRALTIDADGVLHRGQSLLPGAVDLLEALDARGIPWKIVTNNSRQTHQGAAAVYRRLGLPVGDGNVSTAAEALATYIASHATGRRKPLVFSLGSSELDDTLRAAGCRLTRDEERAEWVAVGLDRRLTYRKLQRGADAVRRGAAFVSANLDPTIPSETGEIPGVGSIAAAIQVATGVQPTNIGKPSPELMLQAVDAMGARPEESVHLGDRLDSDVLGARRAGMASVLVETGGHTRDDAMRLPETERPDVIALDLPSLLGWWELTQ
jgi:HAD superfamily hydrolase (TIGR01450 family)